MKTFLLKLDEKTHKELKAYAATNGISMNELITKQILKLIKGAE